MAGVLSLNGTFTYPIELLKTLTVDEDSYFQSAVVIGKGSVTNGSIGLSLGDSETIASKDYSIAIGSKSSTLSKYSIAAGNNAKTGEDGENSIALGIDTISSDKNSFSWSGKSSSPVYETQGEGSFCINPNGDGTNPETGFYIGTNTLPTLINKYAITAVCGNANTFTSANTFNAGMTITDGEISVTGGAITVSDSVETTFSGSVTVPNQQTTDNSKNAANTKFVKDTSVLLTGSTMTGFLTLSQAPTADLHAATKKYVDDTATVTKVDTTMQSSGREVAKISVTNVNGTTESSIRVPKIIQGQNTTVYEDTSTGEIKISCNPNINVTGGTLKVPIGTIIPFAGNSIPSGFLKCDGSELLISSYSELYDAIGTTFGGNGTTTFKLPQLSDNRFMEGASSNGTYKTAGLPNITGKINDTNPSETRETFGETPEAYLEVTGALSAYYHTASPLTDYTTRGSYLCGFDIDASRCSSIYGASSTVQPKSMTIIYCIKYTQTTEEWYVRSVNGISPSDSNGSITLNTEEWKFTLSDGSEVTRTVCLY